MNKLDWHFTDFPAIKEGLSDQLIGLTIDGDLCIVRYDADERCWWDIGRDWERFELGLVAWAYVPNVPETREPMKCPRDIYTKDDTTFIRPPHKMTEEESATMLRHALHMADKIAKESR